MANAHTNVSRRDFPTAGGSAAGRRLSRAKPRGTRRLQGDAPGRIMTP